MKPRHAPAARVLAANDRPIRPRGSYVLYWMIAARRARSNFALDHALAHAIELGRPLIVLEPLRVGYRWACDRFHAFVLDGMADNARAFGGAGITYLPYVEPAPGRGSGLVVALARSACLVVTDEQPGFFLPAMVAAAARRLAVRLETVDGNGVLPLRAHGKPFATAASFRRHVQRIAPLHLAASPSPDPLASVPRAVRDGDVAGSIARRWPFHLVASTASELARLPIDHAIAPVAARGGPVAAHLVVTDFVRTKLARYADERSHPDAAATSGLSPYLHFGHIASHDVIAQVLDAANWDPTSIAAAPVTGSRDGWWGIDTNSEALLDELIVWRELGYGFCFHRLDHMRWSALPAWARATLVDHANDLRPERYTRRELERAVTSDPVWNAAQRELVATGRIHNYLRMLWGKKILEWSRTPRAALATMIELNNKYALDGRDPNSYAGILWTLGLFDRPWGPERPIFGKIRYMSSRATVRKLRMSGYLRRWQ